MSDFNHEKFTPTGRYSMVRNSEFKRDGGVPVGEGRMVVCEIDPQPHYENEHVAREGQRSPKCIEPLEWTSRGVKMGEMDL